MPLRGTPSCIRPWSVAAPVRQRSGRPSIPLQSRISSPTYGGNLRKGKALKLTTHHQSETGAGESRRSNRCRYNGRAALSVILYTARLVMPSDQDEGGRGMRFVLGWTVFVGLIWFVAVIVLRLLAVYTPEYRDTLEPITSDLTSYGLRLGQFIAPVLQLALVLAVLIGVAERLGVLRGTALSSLSLSAVTTSGNIQALIAITIVVALVISALGNIGDVGTLKDLALVVIGFYFGTRRRQGELEAVAAGTAAGIAATEPTRTVQDNTLEAPRQY
jgi:hypothetical protein